MHELCFATACELRRLLINCEVSAVELLTAHIEQIECVNPNVNALVTLDLDNALQTARVLDDKTSKGEEPGLLHGLPLGVKDTFDTAGLRTTYGSPVYKDHIPTSDRLIVEREKKAGAVIVGKTNTPEFAFGATTTNSNFGVTRNPYDLNKTTSGSSGGSAAALAARMVALADGSDIGGSLRSPAAWCNVVGFRPSTGCIPKYPNPLPWDQLDVDGPMARTVEDIALFMSAIAGADTRSPMSDQASPQRFSQPLERDFKNVRIAMSCDLGYLEIDEEVSQIFEKQHFVFSDIGCEVVDKFPTLDGLIDSYWTLRNTQTATLFQDMYKNHHDQLKSVIRENLEAGKRLSAAEVMKAQTDVGRHYQSLCEFMQEYPFLVWPVHICKPFDLEDFKTEAAMIWDPIFLTPALGLPTISVPSGFTGDGIPCGIQIIGRYGQDVEVLKLGFAFQQATQYYKIRPKPIETCD